MSRPSLIEPLENRIAPAGVVTVTFIGGKLSFTGDAADNDFTITATEGGITFVTGNNGTTFAFGDQIFPGIQTESEVKQISAKLGAGADTVVVQELVLAGGLTVFGEAGADQLRLQNVSASGAVAFNGGADNDTFLATGDALRTKQLTVDLGAGENVLSITPTDLTVSGAVKVVAGSGNDDFNLAPNRIAITGSVSLLAGAGVNVVTLSPDTGTIVGAVSVVNLDNLEVPPSVFTLDTGALEIRGPVAISFGAGESNATFNAETSLRIFGTTSVTARAGADNINVTGESVEFLGGVKFSLGDGANTVTTGLSTFAAKSFTYAGGKDADQLVLNASAFTIGGTTNLNLGAGNDSVFASSLAHTYDGLLQIAAGAGTDTLNFSGDLLRLGKGLKFDGGTGADTLTFDPALLLSDGSISAKSSATAGESAEFAIRAGGLHVLGSVSASFGAGQSTFDLTATQALSVLGAITAKTAATGAAIWNVSGSSLFVSGKVGFTVGNGGSSLILDGAGSLGSVAVKTGSGNDTFTLSLTGDVLGSVNAQLGTGVNGATVLGSGALASLQVHKDLVIKSTSLEGENDTGSLDRVTIRGKLNASLGAGTSSFTVRDSVLGNVTILTGGGSDTVGIDDSDSGPSTRIFGVTKIDLGAGGDTLNVGGTGLSARVEFFGKATFDGGDDSDDLASGSPTPLAADNEGSDGNLYDAGAPTVLRFES